MLLNILARLGADPARCGDQPARASERADPGHGCPAWPHRDQRSRRGEQAGFSLLELLIAVAVVGVLAAIAYPTFTHQIVKARRAAVQAELMSLAQLMERTYTETGCYNPGADGDCSAGTPEAPDISRAGDRFDDYDIAFSGEVTASRFLIQATPAAGSVQTDDGVLRINQLGQQFWDENNDGDTTDPNEDDWVRD